MKIEKVLTLSTKERDIIENFGNFIVRICDKTEREDCKVGCIFEEFCSYEKDVSYNFLELLEKEFKCNVNMNFED